MCLLNIKVNNTLRVFSKYREIFQVQSLMDKYSKLIILGLLSNIVNCSSCSTFNGFDSQFNILNFTYIGEYKIELVFRPETEAPMALMEQANMNTSLTLSTSDTTIDITIKNRDIAEQYNTSIASCKNGYS